MNAVMLSDLHNLTSNLTSAVHNAQPVRAGVILSVQDDEAGKVAALDVGADDYVTKPFNTAELLTRLRVALRHASKPEEAPVFQSGRLLVDLASRRVTVDGREVKLTVTEYNLLRLLVRHEGKVLTHRQILREVWG